MILAVIPARANSKRLPGKHLRLLAGHPLLAWTLAAAEGAKTLDEIIVTSDDPAILDVAAGRATMLLGRPAELAQDDTPDWPVADHVLRSVPHLRWTPDDLVIWLRPTAPFRRPEEIDAVGEFLRAHPEVSSVRSVVSSPVHPRKCYVDVGWQSLGYTVLLPYTVRHAANAPSQTLERVFAPVGFIDAVRASVILDGSMEGAVIAAWDAPADRAIEIDDEQDFARAEALATARGWTPGACA